MFITTGRLSSDVKTPRSSLGAYLREMFPLAQKFDPAYGAASGKLLVDSTATLASSGTIGAGIDLTFRIMLDKFHRPEILTSSFPFNEDYQQAIVSLCNCIAFGDDKPDMQARAAWALGLIANSLRAGPLRAPDMYKWINEGPFQFPFLMHKSEDEAPARRELARLKKWGEKRFIPKVRGPFYFGPTFDQGVIGADADLIADGTLIEIKSTLGAKNADQLRPDSLRSNDMYQLLGYALLDYSNRYEIEKLGLYSARYGKFHEWPLATVTSAMSGGDFNLFAARERVWDLMHQELTYI